MKPISSSSRTQSLAVLPSWPCSVMGHIASGVQVEVAVTLLGLKSPVHTHRDGCDSVALEMMCSCHGTSPSPCHLELFHQPVHPPILRWCVSLGMVEHTCSPSIQVAETGGSQV
jgi:hypothetical protein